MLYAAVQILWHLDYLYDKQKYGEELWIFLISRLAAENLQNKNLIMLERTMF